MMPIQVLVVPVWVERLGWMLVHSLWQLLFVAILAAGLLRFMRNRSARSRYAVAVAMLALMAVGPVATWCLVSVEPVQPFLSTRTDEQTGAGRKVASVVQKPVTTEAGSVGFEDARAVADADNLTVVEAERVEVSRLTPEVIVDAAIETSASPELLEGKPASTATLVRESIKKIARTIQPRLPILVGVWLLGVLICCIRPIWGLWIQWRLRHTGLQSVPESIQATLNALIKKLQLTRAVRIAESALVKVPMVVGYLHPMILLPASVITGLTSSQLEAVLAHELAHVRRHDWLINTLQVIAETLLFYHPAVWWLSSRIRHERELCCDDIALGLNVDKAVFARTLLTLEELRQKALVPAMAATGGDLAARVRRLLITSQANPSPAGGTIMGMLVVAAAFALMLTSLFASQPLDEAKTSQNAAAAAQSDYDERPDAESRHLLAAEQKDSPAPKAKNERQRTIQVLDEYDRPVVGAPAQSVDGRPLYKVDTEWSKDFSALNPKADQMVLSGGIREFDHWYAWGTVVPAGHEAIVRVSIPQASGEPQIMEQKLAAGRHTLQFQAKPSDDGITTKLQLRCGKEEEAQNAVLPFRLKQQQQSAAIVNVLDAEKSVRLVERPLEGSEKTLTLEVLLNPLTETGK